MAGVRCQISDAGDKGRNGMSIDTVDFPDHVPAAAFDHWSTKTRATMNLLPRPMLLVSCHQPPWRWPYLHRQSAKQIATRTAAFVSAAVACARPLPPPPRPEVDVRRDKIDMKK
jgi:hypothetical protein